MCSRYSHLSHVTTTTSFCSFSFFLLLSFSPPCISVFPQECVSPQYLSLDGGRVSWCSADGQSVTECGGSGCVGRRRRLRGEESHERLSCCSDPRFRLHSGNMSRNIRTHMCQYMRAQTRSCIDTHLTFTCCNRNCHHHCT